MKDLTSDSGESTDTIDVAHTLEALNDPTVAADTKGNILGFNSAAEKLFGYRRDEIIGKNVKILMPDNYASHHDRYLLQYLVSQEKKLIGCPRALIAVTKSKENIPIILSLGEIESAGFKYYIAVFKSSIDDKGSMSIASQDDDTEDSEGLSLGSPSGCPMSTSSCPLGHIRLIGELDDSMDKFKNMMHHEWQ
jgi:PAS domain S-box-containing protein